MLQEYVFFGLTFKMSRVAFTIPIVNREVYWYGIIITIGFILAAMYGLKRAKQFGVNPDKLFDAVLVTAPVSIICARLYYIIFDPVLTIKDFFAFSTGGIAIYGSIIGAVICGAIMCKIFKLNIPATLDIAALGFLIGQAIGRWGNFINQEAYGTQTGSYWFGISGDTIVRETASTWPVHPCFLYESIWCLLGFVLLHFLSKRRKFNGQIATLYLIWYGIGRFIIEYFRTDSLMIKNTDIKVSMMLSGYLVVAGIIILIVALRRSKNGLNSPIYENVYDPVDEIESGIETDDSQDEVLKQIEEIDLSKSEESDDLQDYDLEADKSVLEDSDDESKEGRD